MKVNPPIAICALLAASMVFMAFGKPDRSYCIADPAGESHWSAVSQQSSSGPDCDPWRFVTVKQPIAAMTVVYTNVVWNQRSRQLLIERTGRIALMREVRDPSLALALLDQLGPLTSYNRYNLTSALANPDAPFLVGSPRTRCYGEVMDAGGFTIEATAASGEKWWSSVDGSCGSRATDAADKRLANAFALAVKRTGAGPAQGETFYMPLN